MLTNIIEGLIFAAASGVTKESIHAFFGENNTEEEIDVALKEIAEKYSGDNGIILIEYNNTYQFQTNPKYSDILADILMPIKERHLSQTVLQTLAIIAYRQPITRSEIEDVRGGVSSDYAIGILLKAELIEIKGKRETPGRPSLFGTTDNFLKRFQLKSLEELPAYEELIKNIQQSGKFNQQSENLYEIKSQSLYHGDLDDALFESNETSETTGDSTESVEVTTTETPVETDTPQETIYDAEPVQDDAFAEAAATTEEADEEADDSDKATEGGDEE